MRKKLLSMLSLCFVFEVAQAQTVAVGDVEALPGETVEFSLNLSSGKADSYTALSFDVQFPTEGFTTTGAYTVSESWTGAMAVVGDVDATGLATIPFANSNAIVGSDVEKLVSISFKVDESVATGVYDVALKNIMFEYGISDKDYASDVIFHVNVVDEVTLDENALEVPKNRTGVNVRIKRTINAGEWSTICLPFAMTAEQVVNAFGDGVELGDFVDTESVYDEQGNTTEISILFDEATEIEANHPYIIKVQAPITEFTADNVDINPSEDDALVEVDNGLTGRRRVVYGGMYGTYHAQTTLEPYALFLTGNNFCYSNGLTKMKAFRAYFVMLDVLTSVEYAQARIQLSFDGEETMGIKSVGNEKLSDDKYYNLSGQRVVQPSKGLYIRNGKKVMLK